MYDLIVIGGGPAGMTAALYALRNGKSVLVLEKHGFGGQITYSPKVENYPGTIQMSGNEFADKLLEQVRTTQRENIIKAGEMVGNLRIKGIAENLTVDYDPEIMLHLITGEEHHWDLYNADTTRVVLRKVCPFDINAFSGYAMITSTFLYNYTGSYNRLIKTEVDTTEENTIIMRDFYYDGYDVKLRFTNDDPLNPLIEMDDQPLVTTGEAFGTIYGDGMLHIYQPTNYVSYYSACEKFIYQYITLWVPGMAAGTNTVGTFIHAIEWISDDEARIYMNQGY